MATQAPLGERCPECGSLETSVRPDAILFACGNCGFETPYQDIVDPPSDG